MFRVILFVHRMSCLNGVRGQGVPGEMLRYFAEGLESFVSLRLDTQVLVMVVRVRVRKEAIRTGSEKRSEDGREERTENGSEKEGEGGSWSKAFDLRCRSALWDSLYIVRIKRQKICDDF